MIMFSRRTKKPFPTLYFNTQGWHIVVSVRHAALARALYLELACITLPSILLTAAAVTRQTT